MAGEQDQHAQEPETVQDPDNGQQNQQPDLSDPDVRELWEAEQAAANEAGAGEDEQEDDEPPAPQDKTPAKPEPKGEAEEEPKGPHPMIPKARLDEALRKATEQERMIAHLQGQIDALSRQRPSAEQPAAQGQQAPAQPAQAGPQDRLNEIRSAQIELAKKFDDGDLTYAELMAEQAKLEDQMFEVREQILQAKIKPQQVQQSDPLYLDTLTAQIEQRNPILKHMTDQFFDPAFDAWQAEAKAIVGMQHKDAQPGTDRYRLLVREAVADLASERAPRYLKAYGYSDDQIQQLMAEQAQAQGKAAPSQPRNAGGQSREAQARQQKLAMQDSMPNALTDMRGNGNVRDVTQTGMPSEGDVEAMSDEEIAALPESVQRRILNVS